MNTLFLNLYNQVLTTAEVENQPSNPETEIQITWSPWSYAMKLNVPLEVMRLSTGLWSEFTTFFH